MRFGTGRTHHRLFLFGTLLGVFFSLFAQISAPIQAATGINQKINFQGRLLNSAGATVPDGFYNIQFKIYQDGDGQSVGNTTGSPAGTLKWTESYLNTASQGVKVQNGFLSVQLGSINAFGSSIDWNQSQLWLSMNIGNTNVSCTPFTSCAPDGEMVPMQALTTAVYALNAMQLGGLTASSFGQLSQNQVWTGYNTYRPTTDSVAAFALQNQSTGASYVTGDSVNNQLILGTASSLTGKLAFATAAGGTLTINPTSSASSFTLTLPAETGTVCTTAATGVCSVAGSGYVQLAPLAVQTDSTANTSIAVNKTNASGSILELQKNGTPVFTVANGGNITASGTINSNTFTSTALNFGGTNPTIGAGLLNTNLTVQANNSGTLTLNTTGAGTIAIGTTNSTTINLGATGTTNTITGTTGINGVTSINASNTLATTIGSGTAAAGTVLLQGGASSAFTVTNATGKSALTFAAPSTAGTVTYRLPAGGTGGNTYDVCTSLTICTGYASSTGFANTALSNLSAVALNTSLLPGVNNSINIGSNALGFASGFFATNVQTPLINTADETVASTNSNALTLRSGNVAGATSNSGSVTLRSGNSTTSGTSGAVIIDSGSTAGGTPGAVSIGATNSTAITAGNTSANTTTLVQGGSGASAIQINQGLGGAISIGTNGTGSSVQVICGVIAGTGCSFAANPTDHSTTIGSATGTSLTTIQGGTGGITLTGNITAAGTYNGNTFGASALTFSGASPVISASTTNTSLTVRANGTGTLTLNTTGAGTVNVGTANSTVIGIGNSSSNNTIAGITGITGTTSINTSGTATTTIGQGTGTSGIITLQGGAGSTFSVTNTSGKSILSFAAPSTAGTVTYQLPNGGTGGSTYEVCTTLVVCTGYSAPGANTALSNLAAVAINTSLLPASNNTIDVGSSTLAFANGYFATNVQAPLFSTFDQTAGSTSSTGVALRSGNANGASSNSGTLTLKSGDATLTSGAVTISSGNSTVSGNSGAITIDSGSVTSGIGGALSIGTLNSRSITLGNISPTTQTLIQGGTGGTALSLQAGTNGAINIGTTNINSVSIGSTTNTSSLTFGQSTAGETINVSNGATAASTTVNILSGVGTAGTATLNLGNNTRVTAISLGNISLSANRTISIGNSTGTANGFVDTINIATNPTTVAGGNTVNIASGTPTGAGTNVVTIGSTANASTTVIQGGTGTNAIQLTQATGAGIIIGNANTGSTVTVQCGAGTSSACGFGTNANDHTTTVGSTFGASATVIQSGTSGISLTGNVVTSGTINTNTFGASALTFSGANPVITASTTNTGMTVQSNGTGTLTLNSGGAGTVNVGTTNTTTIGVGNITAATQTLIQGGTGASALGLQVGSGGTLSVGTALQTTTISVGNISPSTITNIFGGTGLTALNVQVGNGGSINIGTTVQTSNLNLGNTGTSSATLIQGGTAATAIQLTQGTGGGIIIGSAGAGSTVAVLCGAGTSSSCGFANNATDHTTTIGSATGVSLTNIQGGTGGITLGSATTISSRTTFTSGSFSSGATSTITQSLIDNNTAVAATATITSLTFTVPSPTLATGGRLLFISNVGSNAFTLNLGGSSFNLFPSSTATLLWNGTAWTSAGVDGGTLQNAYNNFNGGTTPEILLDATRRGIDIQDSNGGLGAAESLFTVRSSATASTLGNSLFNVLANGRVGINIASTSTTPTLSYDLSFGQVAGTTTARTIGVEAQTTINVGGNGLTLNAGTGNGTGNGGTMFVQAGTSGAGAGATGGALNLQGGTAAGTGISNGGNVNITGGTAAGTGTRGLIQMNGGTVYGSGSYSSASTSTITQSVVDNNSAVSASATAGGLTFTVPSPTTVTAGRILYITNGGANSFLLNIGVSSFNLSPASTATLLWNGTAWTSAGVDGGTLQNNYTNSIGGSTAEIKLDTTRGGLNIQDANTTIGADLLQVNASNGAGIGTTLFSVGNTGSALFRTTVDNVNGFQVQNNTGARVLAVDTSARQMRIYENNGTTNYALVFYDTATTTANYTANTGTVAVGTGAGAISVVSGTSAAITITANAASTWRTTAGSLTVQSGTASDLILNAGSSVVSVNGSGVLKLGTSAGDPGTCTVGAIVYNSTSNTFRGCQGAIPAWATLGTTTPTLQTVFAASAGGTTPEIKADPTRGGLDVQDADSTISGTIFAVRGANPAGLGSSIFNVSSTGVINIGLSDTSTTLLTLDTDTDATYNQGTASNVATAVNGAMFYSASDHNFLCGTAGKWITCNGLLYSNTAASTAINTCTTNCAAFSTNNAATVPANYCQAGRSIRISAKGVYSTTATPTLQFGIYYGTDPTVRANNVLVGTVSGTITTGTGAANLGWGVDSNVVCFTTTSMNGQGNAMVATSATATNTGLIYTNASTAVVTTTAKNFYIFPTWSASSVSNTITAQQMIISGQ